MAVTIHPTAIVDPKAELADGVHVGPYSIIEGNVVIGEATHIHHHAYVADGARIGRNCVVHHSAVVSNTPQDLKFKGTEKTYCHIGDNTTIREFATLHRATIHEAKTHAGTHDGITRIGSDCLIMAYSHVAHDCNIGDHVILANAAQMGGHTTIESFVTIGGLAAIHQFSQIGAYSMVGARQLIIKDVPPYSLVGGDTTRFVGINKIGLERRGFSTATIASIRSAYKLIFDSGLNVSDALAKIETDPAYAIAEVQRIVTFIQNSDRGILGR